MSGESNNPVVSLVQALRADPKKAGSLLVLVAIFAVMLGRQLAGRGPGRPAAAGAAAVASKRNSGDPATAPPSRNSVIAEALQAWTAGPIEPVSRNLFAVRIEYFPMDGSRTTQSAVGDEGFWSNLEKSLALRTDEKLRYENLVASFKVEAEKLQLQSILPESHKAMISGQMVGEGSVVANFRVVKIEPRRVIIEREGITLVIQMK